MDRGFEVIERDAARALRRLEKAVCADYIFLDPPYRMHDAYEKVLGQLSTSPLARLETLVIAEHDKRFDPGDRFGALTRMRRLQQGDAELSFYKFEDLKSRK